MKTSTTRTRMLVKAVTVGLAAAALVAPAASADPAEYTGASADDSVGYSVPDSADAALRPPDVRDGWESRFAAEDGTVGYRTPDGVVTDAPGDETAIRDAWEGRFANPAAHVGYQTPDGFVAGVPTHGRDGRGLTPAGHVGYRTPDGFVTGVPSEATVIRDGWQSRFDGPALRRAGYRTVDGHGPGTSPSPAVPAAEDGFNWSDAGMGAGVMLAIGLGALLILLASRQRGRLAHS